VTDTYRIFGAEMSPYSVKVRSYFRYKNIPHEWIARETRSHPDYARHAKIAIVPLVVTPQDEGLQDSTPIIEKIEQRFPEPSINPSDPVAAFVSAMLEEFGDEWGNKWMFHLRWAREADQLAAAVRLVKTSFLPSAEESKFDEVVKQVRDRMTSRVWFVGSNEITAPQIEASFQEGLKLLDAHLASRPYLFGARPAFGDFGMAGQIYNAWTDPTGYGLVDSLSPNVLAWLQRMLWPRAEGAFEDWTSLEPTMLPFLKSQLGQLFFPWTLANAEAIAKGQEEFSVQLKGQIWTQKPQKYHAKSLDALRQKYQAAGNRQALDSVLERAECLAALQG